MFFSVFLLRDSEISVHVRLISYHATKIMKRTNGWKAMQYFAGDGFL